MVKKKKGEKYECEECGLVIVVEEVCGCDDCLVVCCEAPMSKVVKKAPAKKKLVAKKPKTKPKAKVKKKAKKT